MCSSDLSQVARKTALAAAEIRRADTILHYLYERPVDQPGAYSGQIADLAWQIVVSPIPSERADSTLRLCHIEYRVKGRASGRVYAAATDKVCSQDLNS